MDLSFLAWVNTFDVKPESKLSNLSNGIALHKIITSGLEVPVAGIEYDLEELASNWILRKSNLQILIQRLKEFYRSALDIVIDPFLEGLDLELLARHEPIEAFEEQMLRLLEVVLHATVHCSKKEDNIMNIMQLTPREQTDLMFTIQKMLEKIGAVADKSPKKLTRSARVMKSESAEITDESNGIALDDQIEELRRENSELKDDICDSFADYTSRLEVQKDLALEAFQQMEQKIEDASARESDLLERIASLEQMLKQKEIVQSPINLNNSRVSEENEDLRAKLLEKERNILKLKREVDELSKFVFKSREMRDEMEILQEKARKADLLEEQLKKVNVKLELFQDMKSQSKSLEEQNTKLIQQKVDIEENSKRTISRLETKVENYKQQFLEVSEKSSKLELATNEKDLEINQLKEQLEILKEENSQQQEQISLLSAKVQLATTPQKNAVSIITTVAPTPSPEMLSRALMTPTTKERVVKHDMFKSPSTRGMTVDQSAQVNALEDKLDTTMLLNQKYQQENNLLNKRMKEFEDSTKQLNVNLHESQAKIYELQSELTEAKIKYSKVEEKLKKTENSLQSVQEQFKTKLQDFALKLKTSTSEAAENEVQKRQAQREAEKLKEEQEELRQVLQEKTNNIACLEIEITNLKEKISKLEDELESAVNNEEFSKLQQEAMQAKEDHEILQREHKLIVTAMYNMGLELFKYRSGQLDVNSLLSNSNNSLKNSTNSINTIAAPLSSSTCAPTDDSTYEDLNQTNLTLNDTSEESPKAPVISMPPPTVTKPSLQSVSKVANSVRKPLQTLKHNEVANTPRVPVKSMSVAPTTNKRLTLAERALQVRNGGSASTTTSAAVGSKRKLDDDADAVPSSSVKRQRVTMK